VPCLAIDVEDQKDAQTFKYIQARRIGTEIHGQAPFAGAKKQVFSMLVILF
jgi:hypothetical protein